MFVPSPYPRRIAVQTRSLLASTLAVTLLATTCFAEDGPLVGKELPQLELSNPVKGAAWSQSDLLGSVVVLDFFQLG